MLKSRFFVLALFLFTVAQVRASSPYRLSDQLLKVSKRKYGMLIGYQQGSYTGLELGLETQWKQVKLKKPITLAAAFTYEYQFKAGVQGFKLGPWVKFGRADLTWGVNGLAFSDNEHWRVGFAPAMGFKFIGFHFITSYNFAFGPEEFEDYQKMHLSIRYFISKDRKLNVKRENKDGKKEKKK